MRWFRFYDEALDDPKVQRLPPHLFKAWVNLLCLASKADGKLPGNDDIAFRLRVSVQDAAQQIDELILAGLIDIGPDGVCVMHNWHERQYQSDSSAERTRKYREKRKKKECDVTGDVTVTVQKQSRADTESEAESTRALAREDLKNLGFGLASRGVSPRLQAKAEGLGLNVSALLTRALEGNQPNALFRHLCVAELQRRLPMASPSTLKAALTRDGSAAFATVCQMILEAA